MTSRRRPDLDAAKGWGMFLVVLGHASPPEWAGVLIYSFHMPLFYVISGLLWKDSVRPASLLKRLMWPFWWGSLITWPFWLVKVMALKSDSVPLWAPLIATAYGADLFGYLVHNSALWFLPSLFGLHIVIWLLKQLTASRVVLSACLIVLGVAVLLLSHWVPILRTLPFSLGQGLVGGLFFITGYVLASEPTNFVKKVYVRPVNFIVFTVGFVVFLATQYINGRVDLFSMHFGEPLLYLFNGVLGATLVVILCRVPLAQWAPIRMIGERSLQVLVYQQPVLWILRYILIKMNLEPNSIVLTVATLLLFVLGFKWQDQRLESAKRHAPKEI